MKLSHPNRMLWTVAEIMEELRMGEKLCRKLAAAGCFGPYFQPGGKNGKMWFHRDHIERYIKTNMDENAREMELPGI